MKVLHIMLGNFYIDNYSYQENMLPKFHKELGYDVEIIASLFSYDENGKGMYLAHPSKYMNEYGIPVTRLAYKKDNSFYKRFRRFQGLKQALENAAPDIIFIHNVQFMDIDVVVAYVKAHRNVRVYCDNHADFSNSATNWLSKNLLHGIVWKHCARSIEPYTKKFYGVLPARVDFLKNVYGLPPEKCELLVMGADDDLVEDALKPGVREKTRRRYHINDDDILIMTGGKIDHNKLQTLTLMKAIRQMSNGKLKLVVFGSVLQELQDTFRSLLCDNVIYAGWKEANEIYAEFSGADMVVFPGLHSVLWEQAVAMGKPCVFKKIEGFQHVDLNGNCLFFEDDTLEEYQQKILQTLDMLGNMGTVASLRGMRVFSYREIAKRAIEA